ncbi:MAG: chorismate mutase [Anaerolineae bacterium]
MYCRGVRGATTVEHNTAEEIIAATKELLERIIAANGIEIEDVASVIFTTTPDLNAEFPTLAARALGWRDVALLCSHEMDVPGSLARCIRVLIHWNTEKSAAEIRHVYLKGAQALRPDRALCA